MKKFIFKPQVILDIQIRKVEQIEGDLAEIARELEAARQMLAMHEQEKMQLIADKLEKETNGIKIWELVSYDQSIEEKAVGIENDKFQIESLTNAYSEKQKELSEALMRQKTLEKFKDIRYKDYKHEKQRVENINMDEIAVRGFISKQEVQEWNGEERRGKSDRRERRKER